MIEPAICLILMPLAIVVGWIVGKWLAGDADGYNGSGPFN